VKHGKPGAAGTTYILRHEPFDQGVVMQHVVHALLFSLCFTLSAMAATPVFVIHGGAG
jgi:hypothetical protein